MDFSSFIAVYIGSASVGIMFVFFGFNILKRDKKDRINQSLALFYFLNICAIVFNIVFSSIRDPSLQDFVNILNIFSIFFTNLSTGFLMLFIKLLYNPGKLSKGKNQLAFLLIYGSILSIMFIIPYGVNVKILSDGSQLDPVWNLPFTIFNIAFMVSSACYILWISNKTYHSFNNKILAKRFKFLIGGIIILYYLGIGAILNNYINNDYLRNLFTISMLAFVIGGYFIYYGTGKSTKSLINLNILMGKEKITQLKTSELDK